MKRKSQMVSLLLCGLLAAGVLAGCGAQATPKESSEAPAVSSEAAVEHTIAGTVQEVGEETFVLAKSDGMTYRLRLEGAMVENSFSEEGLVQGSDVTVTYYGDLALTDSVQETVRVTTIVVDALPEEPSLTRAKALLAEMTMEEKVGQMFLARCPDLSAAELAGQYAMGGYILFGRDFEGQTPDSIRAAIDSYQESVDIPMFIGIDEEGGTVVRASGNPAFRSAPFQSPQALFAQGGMETIVEDAKEKSEFLLDLGINLNLAPVADVSTDPNDFINNRTFGQNGKETAKYVSAVVTAMKESGIGSCLKHFPGYGNNVDTHTGISNDNRPYESFETNDFLPFKAGIEAGADCVLVSHNIVACMDEELPASLSKTVHDILREELGFTGVIMTDDLYMDAIQLYTDAGSAAVKAVEAGNDLLCCSDFQTQVPAVIEAVESGQLAEERLDESVLRVLQMKINLGLISLEGAEDSTTNASAVE